MSIEPAAPRRRSRCRAPCCPAIPATTRPGSRSTGCSIAGRRRSSRARRPTRSSRRSGRPRGGGPADRDPRRRPQRRRPQPPRRRLVVSLAPMRDVVDRSGAAARPRRRRGTLERRRRGRVRPRPGRPGGTFGDTGIGGLTLGGGIGWLMPVARADLRQPGRGGGRDRGRLGRDRRRGRRSRAALGAPGRRRQLRVVTGFTYRLTADRTDDRRQDRLSRRAAAAVFDRVERLVAEHADGRPPTGRAASRRRTAAIRRSRFLFGIVDGTDPAPIRRPPAARPAGARRRARAGDVPRSPGARRDPAVRPPPLLEGPLPPRARPRPVRPARRGSRRGRCRRLRVHPARTDRRGGTGRAGGRRGVRQRAAAWNASALAIWESPDDDDTAIGWARRVAAMLEPSSLGGGYVNYAPIDETPDRVRAAYGPSAGSGSSP